MFLESAGIVRHSKTLQALMIGTFELLLPLLRTLGHLVPAGGPQGVKESSAKERFGGFIDVGERGTFF